MGKGYLLLQGPGEHPYTTPSAPQCTERPTLHRLQTLTLKVHFYLAVGGWENQDCFIAFHNLRVIAI